MSQESFEAIYDGEALRSGVMDVKDLAPALLAVSELLQEANRVLNGERARVAVRIRSDFRRGSFPVSLEVAQSLIEQAKSALLGDDLRAAKALLELLFGSYGVFRLIKWLRGRRATASTPLPGNSVKIEINNTYIEIHADAARLYNSPVIREAAYGIVRPMETEGIDTFEIRRGGTVLESVTKEEVHCFVEPTFEEALLEDERRGAYEVVTLSFENRYKWRFTDGNANFTADILDESFFKRLQNRQIAFAKGDILTVRLRTKTWKTEKGLRTSHEVLEVLEVTPGPRQVPLLPAPSQQGLPEGDDQE